MLCEEMLGHRVEHLVLNAVVQLDGLVGDDVVMLLLNVVSGTGLYLTDVDHTERKCAENYNK